MKFLFGDILEELLLFLSREAGHDVQGEQDELTISGVKGHRDAVIDGVTTDTKSASSRSFDKFANHLTPDTDDFGYLTQLDSYREAGKEDSLVSDKTRAAFLVVDKTLGKIVLDIQDKRDTNYEREIVLTKRILSLPSPPPRAYDDVYDGKSGNKKLGTACSYCPFKFKCWENLEVYYYANGPRFMTVVAREPKVEKESGENH